MKSLVLQNKCTEIVMQGKTEKEIGLKKGAGFWLPLILHLCLFLALAQSSSANCLSSSVSYTETYSETYTANVTEFVTEPTPTMSYSVPVSSTPTPLMNCYQVCVCNETSASTAYYNMTMNVTQSMNMTSMSADMTSMPANMTSSPVIMTSSPVAMTSMSLNSSSDVSPSPSCVNITWSSSANVSAVSYSCAPMPSSSASVAPFHCPNDTCWVENHCYSASSDYSRASMTPYTTDSVVASTSEPQMSSSSVAPTTAPPVCEQEDCNGDCDGSAVINCGLCVGGNSGRFENETEDCEGVCNGTARYDSCDICARPNSANPSSLRSEFMDCNDTCSGKATYDNCAMCTGGATGLAPDYAKDACGVCNGTNSTCAGCDGVPNSGKELDACGECDGDGSTCTDIMATVPQTIASSAPTVMVIGAGLNQGSGAICLLSDRLLSDPGTGDMVVNATAQVFNLTHAQCEFQPWPSYTSGVYNLTVMVTYDSEPAITTNSSLQVYYYSVQNLSLTGVVPNELLKNQLPQDVFLVGSGFFNWTESVCFIGSAQVDAIYVNSTHLQCNVMASQSSVQLPVSLSMDGGLVRVGSNINFTIYASAPNVSAVKFSNTAAKIVITFAMEAELTSSAGPSCDDIFNAATVSKLGTSPSCSMSSTVMLQIASGIGATVSVGDNLVFKDNMIKARGEMYSKYVSGSYPVSAPDTPIEPVPVITGSPVMSSCGNLTLSGSQSTGGGGRQLKFKWTLMSPSSGVTNITDVLSGLADDVDDVNLDGSLFTSNVTYQFQLGAANFLNPSSFKNATHSVTKATEPVPEITLDSNVDLSSDVKVYASEELSITADAIVAPCVNNTKVDFSWTVACSDASAKAKVESSASFMGSRTQSTVRISEGVLTGDQVFTFTVTASMNYRPSVQSDLSQEVTVLPSPLVANIKGGNRQVGQDSGTVELDAQSFTEDPDNSNDALSCNWRCEENGGPCRSAITAGAIIFASLSSDCIVHVESNQFTTGEKVISVDVTKGARSATTSVTMTIAEGNPPAVSVLLPSMKITSNERVSLEGYFKINTQPTRVAWICAQEQGYGFVDVSGYSIFQVLKLGNESFAQITLEAGLLTPGINYLFQLLVSDGVKEGVASVTVEVRNGPTSGTLEVDRNSVQALETIEISAPLWITDSDAYPLQYEFGVETSAGVCQPWGSSKSTRTQLVPQGTGPNNTLTLCVLVTDKFGSVAKKTLNITSSPSDSSGLTPDALDSLIDDAVDTQLQSGDLDGAIGALMSISDTVQNSANTSDALKRNISQKTQAIVEGILAANDIIDGKTAASLFTVLTTTDANATANRSNMASAAKKIMQGMSDQPISNEQANDFLEFVGDLASGSAQDDEAVLKQNVKGVVEELAKNLAQNQVLGDPPREVSNPNVGTIRVEASTLQAAVPTSTKPGAPTFDPGEALGDMFGAPRDCGGGKTCTGVVLKLVHFSENLLPVDESAQSSSVAVVETQIIGIDLVNPVTGQPITITGLAQPLKLKFTATTIPDGKQYGCKVFDEPTKVWVVTGLTVIGPVNGTLTCESTHASFFAPSHDDIATTAPPVNTTTVAKESPTEADKDNTWAIVGGVIGGIVFVVIVVVGFLWCSKHKKDNSGRVSPLTPEGDP